MVAKAKPAELTTPPPTLGPPPITPGTPNHDFITQIVFETQKSVGALDATVKHLVGSIEKHDAKLDKILEEFNIAKGTWAAVNTMAKIMGTIALALLTSILGVLLKHFHWI